MVINFYQYQQNEQSRLIFKSELTEHKNNHDIWGWKSRSCAISAYHN